MKFWGILLFLLAGCGQQEALLIGAALPLTGPGAEVGQDLQRGMQLAIRELHSEGIAVELIIEDSQSKPSTGVLAYNTIALQKPKVIVSALSGVSLALVTRAEQEQIPLLATVATAPQLTESEWTYRYYHTMEQEAPILLDLFADEITTLGILAVDDELGESLPRLLEEFSGTTVIERYPKSTKEFGTALTKLLEKNPEGILVIGFPSHIVNILPEVYEATYDGNLYFTSTVTLPTIQDQVRDRVYSPATTLYERETPFQTAYQELYGIQASHYAAAGYDVVHLAARNDLDEVKVFEGVLGRSEKNQQGDFLYEVKPAFVENGKLSYVFT